jgi:gallate dioxygenase
VTGSAENLTISANEERELVRTLDWRGMIHYGGSFFMLEKLGAVVGVSNLHIYAAMRGQTLEDFQKTRNAPGALYSVAGTDAGQQRPSWDKADPASGVESVGLPGGELRLERSS